MKLSDIIKVVSQELGAKDLTEINAQLKKQETLKFRISGKSLGHSGFKGRIKSISEEGVKVFQVNKVVLIRLDEIDNFEKAKPREERPQRAAKSKTKEALNKAAKPKDKANEKSEEKLSAKSSAKPATSAKPKTEDKKSKSPAPSKMKNQYFDEDDFDDDDFDDDDGFEVEEKEQRPKRHKLKPPGKSGSKFIPSGKKK